MPADVIADLVPFVEAPIRYSERAANGGTIFGADAFSFKMENHPVRVHNARLADISFEKNGFTLVTSKTNVDLTNQEEAVRDYHPEIERMVKDLTGADEVFVFMGILRGGEQKVAGGPAHSAHADFTEFSLHEWLDKNVPDRAEELKRKRLVNINVWRPLRPVYNSPLALCDKDSVERDDWLEVYFDMSGNGKTKAPAGLNMAFNPNHRWYYYPEMQPEEALVFQLLDTSDDSWKMTGHTAFNDPTSPENAPPRISYEIRTIAVFD